MAGKSATSRLSSLYRFLWGIPLRGSLLALGLSANLLSALILIYVGGFNEYSPLVIAGFMSSIALNWALDRFGGDLGMLNLRRLDQLAIINSCFLLLGVAASLTPLKLSGFGLMAALGAFIRTIVYLTLAGRRAWKALPFLALIMLMESAPTCLLQNPAYGVALLKSYFIAFALASFLSLLFRKLFLIQGVPALDYVSGVLAFLLDDRRDWITELASRLDDESSIQVDIIVFREKNGRPEAAILIPTFHPGPFKDFGSSGLPYLISRELSSIGVKALFFKGFSNHHNNLISEEDCRLIAESIRNALSDNSRNLFYTSYAYAPISLRIDHVKGMLLGVGGAKLLFVTMHPRGMEDIPSALAERLQDSTLIPVDCHNSFSDMVKDLDGGSLNSISALLEKAERADLEKRLQLVFGYAQAKLEGYSREDGIGDLGISAAAFMLEGSPTAIISLDGNNCLPEVREKVVEKLRSIGFEEVEVLTTDTHIVNGLRFGGRGYHPLGEVISADVIAEKAFEVAERARRSAKPMEAAWIRLKFLNVKVMSSSFLEEAAARTGQGIISFFLFLLVAGVLGALA